jgi:hypothetical protein
LPGGCREVYVGFMPAFTSTTARDAARKSHGPRGLKRAIRLEKLCFDAAISLEGRIRSSKDGCSREDAQALAAIMRGWEAAAERRRILAGEPMPGSLRPTRANGRGPKATASEFAALDKATVSEFAALDTGRSEFAELDRQ